MGLELSNITLTDIFLPIVSTFMLGLISVFLFYWFRRSEEKLFPCTRVPSHFNKKKPKKKIQPVKSEKNIEDYDEISYDFSKEEKHVEIKNNPEIVDIEEVKEIHVNLLSSPVKPILRKSEDKILVNEVDVPEIVWNKVPKDELEVYRSRHSSLISEARSEIKDEPAASNKLSKKQKKKLKAKLKSLETTTIELTANVDMNNSSLDDSFTGTANTDINALIELPIKTGLTKSQKKRLNKKAKPLPKDNDNSLIEKCDLIETDDDRLFSDQLQLQLDDSETMLYHDDDSNMNSLNTNNLHLASTDLCRRWEEENKILKEENVALLKRNNELTNSIATAGALKSELDISTKKLKDHEKTFAALQKELTNTIQKLTSAENRILRLTSDSNQQITYYQGEITSSNNKVQMLDNEIRAKSKECETLKTSVEKMRAMLSDKDQHIKNFTTENYSLKDQISKKKSEIQDFESQTQNYLTIIEELENTKRKFCDENQHLRIQLDNFGREKNKITEAFDTYKQTTENREKEKDCLLQSLQYQIDELQNEKQQLIVYDTENEELKCENRKLQKLNDSLVIQRNSSTIPSGFQLIESSQIQRLTSIINETNNKLVEKCEQFKIKENDLLSKNRVLEEKYSKINSELQGHLNEMVNLRRSIEVLQLELTKCSGDVNIDELKREFRDKNEQLVKVEGILRKLEESVEEDERKFHCRIEECTIENNQLKEEIRQQKLIIDEQSRKINELESTCSSQSLNGGL